MQSEHFGLEAFACASTHTIINTMDVNIHYIDLESSTGYSNGREFEQSAWIMA